MVREAKVFFHSDLYMGSLLLTLMDGDSFHLRFRSELVLLGA